MSIATTLILSIGLASDASTVAICNGIGHPKMSKSKTLQISLTFGIFQGVMPLIGFLIGGLFIEYIKTFIPLISFIILSLLGMKMIFAKSDDDLSNKELSFKEIITQGIATSIDALAIGIIFAGTSDLSELLINVGVIAVVTTILCFAGVMLSKKIGNLLKDNAQLVGGIMLILVGLFMYIESFL